MDRNYKFLPDLVDVNAMESLSVTYVKETYYELLYRDKVKDINNIVTYALEATV